MDVFPAIVIAMGLVALPEDDKRMHFLAGAAIAEVARHYELPPVKSCAVALAVGLAKEAYDSQTNGTVDARDAVATALGCGVTFRF